MHYTQQLTAFLDILGFKEIIGNQATSLNANFSVEDVFYMLDTIRKERNWDTATFKTTTFSDSIVISAELEDNLDLRRSNMFNLFMSIVHLQIQLLVRYGRFLRGGIVIDNLFHDNIKNIVYGPAMNKAYLLESKVAVYPRIVVEGICLDTLIQAEEHCETDIALDRSLFRVDTDDCLYLDTLGMPSEFKDNREYADFMIRTRNTILGELNHYQNKLRNYRIHQKYVWLKKYFNSLVEGNRGNIKAMIKPIKLIDGIYK